MGEYRIDMVSDTQRAPEPQEETEGVTSPEGEAEDNQGELNEVLEQARNEAEQWKDRCLRSVAELDNFRKRVERDREQQALRLRAEVMRQLLPIADDFHLALENVPTAYSGEPWVQGLLLIAGKIDALLSQSGVAPIPAVGEPFDPNYHDALMQEESEYPEGIVSGEIRKGYIMGDHVLRPTLVRVSAGPAKAERN
jgi:molecular chaperone GrpE